MSPAIIDTDKYGWDDSDVVILPAPVGKINPCHVPSGPKGGQFCETGARDVRGQWTSGSGGSFVLEAPLKTTYYNEKTGRQEQVKIPKKDSVNLISVSDGFVHVTHNGKDLGVHQKEFETAVGRKLNLGSLTGRDPTHPAEYSSKEVDAIHSYSYKGIGGKSIQGFQKDLIAGKLNESNSELVRSLDAAVSKSSLKTDSVLYRGVSGAYAKGLDKLKPGEQRTLPNYQSTTADLKMATNFTIGKESILGVSYEALRSGDTHAKGRLLVITVPKGTPALDVNRTMRSHDLPVDPFSSSEILLGRNTALRFDRKEGQVLHFSVIPSGGVK